ncbi:MAG: hypothetical protein M0P47_11145 [Bacteroidales bacterium]|nr:hypothetical protein [Bacteroidales bacterium]
MKPIDKLDTLINQVNLVYEQLEALSFSDFVFKFFDLGKLLFAAFLKSHTHLGFPVHGFQDSGA